HGIYVVDYGDSLPDSRVLVSAGYLPKELLIDPLDPTPDGWMNRYRVLHASPLTSEPYPHFDSYWNVSELLGPPLTDRLQGRDPDFGWLVAPYMTTSDGLTKYSGIFVGTYQRLRFDGSVITRKHRLIPEELLDPRFDRGQSHHSYFSDLDDYGSFE
ncbi:MAG: hypothetical protein ACOCX1_05470, partial [Fimbriimonadaceae bacterium]